MFSVAASHYFIPPPGYFWGWDPTDGAAVWWDGSTLAFPTELIPVLQLLAQQGGLPPLGSILLVLHAAKDPNWKTGWEAVKVHCQSLGEKNNTPSVLVPLLHFAEKTLELVSELQEPFRKTPAARAELLRVLFEPIFNRLPVDRSIALVDEFRADPMGVLSGKHDLGGLVRVTRDLKAIVAARRRWTHESLENRLATGLPDITRETAEVGRIEIRVEAHQLWAGLETSPDNEVRATATIARQALAMLDLPRPLRTAEDQPVGGVSDLSNRGDPARLVLSEWALDEDTLMIRLAHQEALYLRRESPPASPYPGRTILLDNGLFLWGNARIFTTAVAMALVASSLSPSSTRVVGHQGDIFLPIALETDLDLRSWWSRLDPKPDGGECVLRELAEWLLLPENEQPELIWVTHPHSAARLAAALAKLPWPPHARFIICAVDGEGKLRLSRRTQAGEKELACFTLESPPLLRAVADAVHK